MIDGADHSDLIARLRLGNPRALCAARLAVGISQVRLAQLAGVSQPAVSMWSTGAMRVTGPGAARFLAVLEALVRGADADLDVEKLADSALTQRPFLSDTPGNRAAAVGDSGFAEGAAFRVGFARRLIPGAMDGAAHPLHGRAADQDDRHADDHGL